MNNRIQTMARAKQRQMKFRNRCYTVSKILTAFGLVGIIAVGSADPEYSEPSAVAIGLAICAGILAIGHFLKKVSCK